MKTKRKKQLNEKEQDERKNTRMNEIKMKMV